MRGRPGQTAWRMVGRVMRWTGTRLFVWGEDSWERKEMWKEAYAAALGKGSAMFFLSLFGLGIILRVLRAEGLSGRGGVGVDVSIENDAW